jgi:hypothetical protein
MGVSHVVRSMRAVIVCGLVAVGLIGATTTAASAATCESWGGQPPDAGSGNNQLQGVAATSACNAFAGGSYYNGTADQTLIERWNGNVWKIQPSENPGGTGEDNHISDVAATSPTNAWAVGSYYNGTADQTLIEHWNGTEWKVQASVNLGGSANDNDLYGVAATSPTNAWAVGSYFNGTTIQTLIEHWNGKSWNVQASPTPGNASCLMQRAALATRASIGLLSVAASSPSDAWAVGVRCGSHADQTLIEHWNGKSWKVKVSPDPGGTDNPNGLSGVAATSSTNAWAVGSYYNGTANKTLIERWNGTAWKVQSSPAPGGSSASSGLADVAATSPTNAWAVGNRFSRLLDPPIVERWNGKAWKLQRSASFPDGSLFGVAAVSSSDAWAVGDYSNGTDTQNLILHCC